MQVSSRYTLTIASIVAVTTLALFNNCGQVKFSSTPNANQQSPSAQGTTTPTTSNNGGGTTSTPPPPVVCNPFGGGGSATSTEGLEANDVYYVDQSQIPPVQANDSSWSWNSTYISNAIQNSVENLLNPVNIVTASGAPLILSSAVNLFLPDINYPDMYFTQGFVNAANGQALQDASGNTLTSYFGFRLKSNFVAGNWAPGDYQIAILSDDGSILTMTGAASDGSNFVINDDGFHSMQMACSTQTIHVTANSEFPLTFDYMQGPPITIGMIMLYRPVSVAGTAQDPLCGQGGGSDSYFFLDHNGSTPINPSEPQAPYLQLTGPFNPSTGSGGWTPVEANHFVLPSNNTNPCAGTD